MDAPLKVGQYITWTIGGRSQCAAVESYSERGVLAHVGDRIFELVRWDEIELLAPDLSGYANGLDWSKG